MSFASEFRRVPEPSHAPPAGPSSASPPDTYDAGGVAPPAEVLPGTPHAFGKALACAAVTCATTTGLLVFFVARDASPDSIASVWLLATVNILLLLAIPCASLAVITGLVVQSSQRAWPLWGIALAFLSMFLALILLIAGLAAL